MILQAYVIITKNNQRRTHLVVEVGKVVSVAVLIAVAVFVVALLVALSVAVVAVAASSLAVVVAIEQPRSLLLNGVL